MEERKIYRIFWAAHCIDLMLEYFEKKIPIQEETNPKGSKITTDIYSRTSLVSLLQHFTRGKDLVRLGITGFAISYLTLGRLHDNKEALFRMFTAKERKSRISARTKEEKFRKWFLYKEFWKNALTSLKVAYPIIEVLNLVDSDEKPVMAFIYETMDQAKEKIKKLSVVPRNSNYEVLYFSLSWNACSYFLCLKTN